MQETATSATVAPLAVAPSTAPVPLWPTLVALSVSVCALAVLVWLPYTTSWIVSASLLSAREAPASDLEVGGLTWDYGLFRTAPSLAPFRSAFGSCQSLGGVAAARCVTDIIAQRSPVGTPEVEFVDARFDPAAALTAHLSGAMGHCTTRSALGATALLALGIPARVVQLLPVSGNGHNVFEVYDHEHGWVVFDPTSDSSVLADDDYASSVEIVEASKGLTWRRPHSFAPDPNVFAGSTVNYPEPWLYTRVGPRCASWPFRGCFAQVGPTRFMIGPAQRLALLSALLSAAFAACWLAWWGRQRLNA